MSKRVVYGNAWSENGWPMVNVDECDNGYIPGTAVRLPIRSGPPNVILKAFASLFNDRIEELDQSQCGAWTPTNDVPTSNHLAGTGMDLNWRRHPFLVSGTFGPKLPALRALLAQFEGTVFYGGDWASPVDEMHFQLNYPEGDRRNAEFAAKLLNGHLGVYAPADPNAFPLPPGYYWGPADGPEESVSGEFGEPQDWLDGLGRWQATLGLPVTKRWDDGATPAAAEALQRAKGWPANPAFGYGGVYEGEWDAVVKAGWRLPAGWSPHQPVALTKWADVSEYQTYLTPEYPHPVICLRASVADADHADGTRWGGVDRKFLENMRVAKQMVAAGKLKKVIAYHFWVPGADNWGTFMSALEQAGGVFPELAFMLDVEDGGTKWSISGDQSTGANDFIKRGQDYFGNPLAASGYLNLFSNGALWTNRPPGLKLIVPSYNGADGKPWTPPGVSYFAHQYADNENTPPFGPCDVNQAHLALDDFLLMWGTNRPAGQPATPTPTPTPAPTPTPVPVPVPAPAGDDKVRTILRLNDRPRDPRAGDDLYGHVLNARAEGLITQALVAEIVTKINNPNYQMRDVQSVRDAVKRSLL